MPNPSLSQTIRRLWRILSKRRRRHFLFVVVLFVVGSLIDVVSLGAVYPFLGVLTKPETVFAWPMVQDVAGSLGITRADQLVLPLTLMFVIVTVLAASFRLLIMWINNRLSYAVGHEISALVYKATLYQPYSVHVRRNSSEVIAGVGKANSATGMLFGLLTSISSILVSSAIITTLIVINPVIASSMLFGFGLCYAGITWVVRRRLYKNSMCVAQESILRIKALQEGLGGIREVLLNGCQGFYTDIYRRSDWAVRHALSINQFLGSSPRFAVEALAMVLIAMLAYWLSLRTGGLESALPLIGALALGAQRLLPAQQQLYEAWVKISGSRASVIDTLDLLEQPLPAADLLAQPAPIGLEKEMRIENLYFRYTENGPWVIRDLNLRISKGVRVGFVGNTGCGKSTTLDLIMGLLLPTSGLIVVDGLPLSGERLRAWQGAIAHVPQSIFMADISVAENIAFGELPEAIDMKRVRQAASQAQLAEFIENNPKGYNTLIGERGIRFSGGQRQRLGIARALYKQADVLVFDEATSSLDQETEQDVMDAIEGLGRELTILIIAHRLSTIRFCDTIIKLRKDEMVVQGTYEQIIGQV